MLEVLHSRQQLHEARRALRAGRRSALTPAALSVLRRWHLAPGLCVGDYQKSWDVARTLQLIEERLPKHAPILDLGAYCSEVPVSLALMGYSNVHGIDLNSEVHKMPCAGRVRYSVGNFNSTSFADASFDAITAISVIEHGYEPQRLYAEVSRMLRPGGLFIASFDYWPQKIDTRGTKFFDLSWLIFSEPDFHSMVEVAARHGLHPLGEIRTTATHRTVHCAGFDYTFAWSVLQRK